MSEERLTYSFGPIERRGILGPIQGGQAALVAFGALAAIIVLDESPSAGGALVAMLVFVAALAGAFAPVGGRTLQEWAPVGIRFVLRRRGRFASRVATAGRIHG
ncbi:MAG: hypothetical protein WAK93_09130, partial [Solirubrobacteraceae bacterium]